MLNRTLNLSSKTMGRFHTPSPLRKNRMCALCNTGVISSKTTYLWICQPRFDVWVETRRNCVYANSNARTLPTRANISEIVMLCFHNCWAWAFLDKTNERLNCVWVGEWPIYATRQSQSITFTFWGNRPGPGRTPFLAKRHERWNLNDSQLMSLLNPPAPACRGHQGCGFRFNSLFNNYGSSAIKLSAVSCFEGPNSVLIRLARSPTRDSSDH